MRGDFARGWPEYEWRLKQKKRRRHHFPFPWWNGESLAGKTLLVYAEQGIGDEIFFASCLPEIIARAGHCIVECEPRLAPLFARSFPQATIHGGDRQAGLGWLTGLPAVDLQVAAGSVLQHLRPDAGSFPSRGAFLSADAQAVAGWRGRLAALGDGLKVGISWRGGRLARQRRERSTRLQQWAALLALPRAHFVNLQYGDCGAELDEVRARSGVAIHAWDAPDPLVDMDGFAALVSALDLVISVDNSTVHLAGALGVPTWLLLPQVPEWRWFSGRADSPWYPCVRIFRQPVLGDWDGVMSEAARELRMRLANFPA
jgi:hypothetical protein